VLQDTPHRGAHELAPGASLMTTSVETAWAWLPLALSAVAAVLLGRFLTRYVHKEPGCACFASQTVLKKCVIFVWCAPTYIRLFAKERARLGRRCVSRRTSERETTQHWCVALLWCILHGLIYL